MLIVSQIQFVRPEERGRILNLYCIWVKKQQQCLFFMKEKNKEYDFLFHEESKKDNASFVRRGINVENKDNAYFVMWEWRETKTMLILCSGKQRECLICALGNKENFDFVRWETRRMLIL
jgi:hypothetical protein